MSENEPTQEMPATPPGAGYPPPAPPPAYGPGYAQAPQPASGTGFPQTPPGYGPGYPHPPHGYAPGPYPPARPTNGLAIGALVAGILALLVCLIPFVNVFGIVAGIAGVVLGIFGLRAARTRQGAGRGMSIAGLVTGAIALVVSVVVLVVTVSAIRQASEQFGDVQRLVGELEGLEEGGEGLDLEGLFGGEGLERLLPETERPDPSTAVGIGEPAVDGDLEFTVTGVEPVGGVLAEDTAAVRAEGQFVLVHVTVRNTGDEALPFVGAFQTLVDDQGGEHTPHLVASLTDPRAQALTGTVEPGDVLEGSLVYDLPADVVPAEVVLSATLFFGGVLVDLS